ncbi:MAG: hypothetical protein JWN52_5709 [Actinomycetia bacterium]|nr:hypothetical protein [Actinomycetes bacterium]
MSHQKLAVLVAATSVGLAVVSGASPASAATAQPSAATKSSALSSTSTASVSRKSFNCQSPKGEHLNVSWKQGMETTFYFNNHCDQKRAIVINITHCPWCNRTALIDVNRHTKGKKKKDTGSGTKITVTSASY